MEHRQPSMLESNSAEALHCGGHDHQHAGQRIIYRLATAADVEAYYGERQRQTLRAVIVEQEGRPFFIVGLANEDGYLKAFSEYKPGFKPLLRRMAVLRAIRTVQAWVEQSRIPVVAVAQPNEPESPAFLARRGFEFHSTAEDGDIYEWLG